MGERKYFVLSLKHLYPWKFGETLCLWGSKRTNDNEDRCYGGYSGDIQRAELYSSEEFLKYYERCTKKEPLTALIPSELKALKKVFDCVLIPKDVVERYYKDCGLITEHESTESKEEIKALRFELEHKELKIKLEEKKELIKKKDEIIESAFKRESNLRDRIADLEAELAALKDERRWRKFPDEKPKWGQEVLVLADDGDIRRVRFSCDYKWISWGNMRTCESSCITHWMPEPKKPEEQ